MTNPSGFYALGIAPNILAVLDKLQFKQPTTIQEQSIPQLIEGKDLIGIAQTGTGKTLAFGVPMIQAVLQGKQGLIVLPTRELAIQVEEVLRKVGGSLGLRTAILIGGESMDRQKRALRANPMIVIGTPGRIIDHLEQKTVTLQNVSMLVLDEADRMLDMGFAPQLKRILSVVPKDRQTMLFSATMPTNIVSIAQTYMKLPVRVEIAPPGTTAEHVTQEVFFVPRADKPRLLEKVLLSSRGAVLVFSRTKFGAKRIAAEVRAMGITAAELHSNKSLTQRRAALDGFRNGKYRVLVATDIASRGIDVKGIEIVINYDLPMTPEDYVHRIGRTGRAEGIGHAISFATPDQKGDVRDIERLIRTALPLSALPELPPLRTPVHQAFTPAPFERSGSGGYRRSSAPARGYGGGAVGGFRRSSSRGARPSFGGGARSSSTSTPGSHAPARRPFRSNARRAPRKDF